MVPVLQKPIPRQMRGQLEYVLTHTPFSPSDLVIWEKDISSSQSDSQTVIKTLQFIIKSHNPSWGDMTQLFHIFLIKDEILNYLRKLKKLLIGQLSPHQDK